MTSIIKKELRNYFTTMTGYIFLAFFILVTSLVFVQNNLLNASNNYSQTLYGTMFAYLLLIPILTMRLFSEEARQKTDQLLYTSPIKIRDIVIGKYLSALILFLIGIAITMTFPLILSKYGTVLTTEFYTGLFGYILLIASLISIGILISVITDNQIVAAAITFGSLFLLFFLDNIAPSLPKDHKSSVIFLIIVSTLIAYILYDSTKSLFASIVCELICVLLIIILYKINLTFFDSTMFKVLNWFSLIHRFTDFTINTIKLSNCVYYISFIVAFNYFTINTIEKRRWK